MEIITLYNKLKAIGLSPNEFTLLTFLYKGINENFTFNEHLSRRILIRDGFIDKSGILTQKGRALFGESEDNIEKYRNLFPKGILPNGKPARSSYSELSQKFKWFLSIHNYSWDTILKATDEYVKYYAKQNNNYMQTSSNFVSKQDNNRIKSSALAEWCEKVLTGDEINEGFDINV